MTFDPHQTTKSVPVGRKRADWLLLTAPFREHDGRARVWRLAANSAGLSTFAFRNTAQNTPNRNINSC